MNPKPCGFDVITEVLKLILRPRAATNFLRVLGCAFELVGWVHLGEGAVAHQGPMRRHGPALPFVDDLK